MICLGIESTAHTFGAGIASDDSKRKRIGKILSDEKESFFVSRGIHPREAAEHHSEAAGAVLERALAKAGLTMKDVDLISFSQGPGIPPCLCVGAAFARALSLFHKKPLLGVNHCVAHIEVAKLATDARDPIVLFVSGGNSQVIGLAGGKYRVFGETLDIAVGNAIDKLARELDLGFPGGPRIAELASKGKYVELPYNVKGMDFSFSGLLTEVIRRHKSGKQSTEDLCHSFQENAFAMLVEATERAVSHTEKTEVLLTGGVAASKRLSEMLGTMCKERGAKFSVVPREYSGDCGAMIAWQGLLEYGAGRRQKVSDTRIIRNWRTDDVEVDWA